MIDATVHNGTPTPVSLIEVDYPSASFGTQTLAPNADFHYRFKIIGSGPLSITWSDAARAQHTAKGPDLHEGDAGRLTITLTPAGAQWSPSIRNASTPAPTSSAT